MDPLSIGASIIGLLGVAAKMTSYLNAITTSISEAPGLVRTVLAEMADITAVLEQLQAYVFGTASVDQNKGCCIQFDNVLATLSGCVATYSELEAVIDGLDVVPELGNFDRVRWSLKESKILALVQRLQNHKASLTLMLTIMQCKSVLAAVNLMNHLQNSVDQLLRSNKELAGRIRGLEKEGSVISRREDDETHLAPSYRSARSCRSNRSRSESVKSVRFAFEEDLKSSQAYKIVYGPAQVSLSSSALCDSALSVFSKMSLDRVSCIAVYALPVYSKDLHNDQWYTFGDIGAEIALVTYMNSPNASMAKSLPHTGPQPAPQILSEKGETKLRSIATSQKTFRGKKSAKNTRIVARESLDFLLLTG